MVADQPERIVVIGNGMVGQRFCERLVERAVARAPKVTVLSEEPTPAYDRIHLTDLWSGKRPQELLLKSRQWYTDHGIDLRLGEKACSIDIAQRRVRSSSGASFVYDKLVIATGSRADMPKISVEPGATILAYRTLADAQRIHAEGLASRDQKRVIAVVGAGLLGLEAARALQRLGCRVTLLEASSQVLPRQLDSAAAAHLERILREHQLELMLQARIERITRTKAGVRIEFDGLPALEAGVVVAAVGVRANDEIAREAGIRCTGRGGIRVDSRLRTSDPHVFAIGECASHARVPHGLVAPGYAMADALSAAFLGRRCRLGPQHAVTRLKLDLTEVTVLGNPLAAGAGRDYVHASDGSYRRIVVDGRRVVAALCVGSWDELPILQQAIGEHRRFGRRRFTRFEASGRLGFSVANIDVRQLPEAAVVCQCAAVTCEALKRAQGAGHNSSEKLSAATGAGTLCGSCRPLLAALCRAQDGVTGGMVTSFLPPRRVTGLTVMGTLALVLTALMLSVPRIPVARSVQQVGIDFLWINPLSKQITGFTLVGLTLFGLGLSLRKRVKGFSIGKYASWRVAHAAFGVLALVALVCHTGLRLGNNLNFALMLAFLMSAFTGAGAGVLASLAQASPGEAALQRYASSTRSLHDMTFWALPVLIGFHLLKVYYF